MKELSNWARRVTQGELHRWRRALSGEEGAISTEYATVAVAACGAGGILYQFLTSSAFSDLLGKILMTAFKWIFSIG